MSDDPDIRRFEPRLPAGAADTEPVVWAVDDPHLANYLFPRDCPRIALRRGPASSAADVAQWLGARDVETVLYMEADWLQRALLTPVWIYGLPAASFRSADANAGYFTSVVPVVPESARRVDSPLTELLARDVELRVVPRLRGVADAVTSSSLAFSVIRLRNARA